MMVQFITLIYNKMYRMAQGLKFRLIKPYTLAIGQMVRKMAKEFKSYLKEQFMMDSGTKIKEMVKDLLNYQTNNLIVQN